MHPVAALAVFVKTPGCSPVKTRLAAGIGRQMAEEFYERSIAAVQQTACDASQSLAAHWAVAESDALDDVRWRRFPTIAQGDGSLGMRLHRVHRDLRAAFGSVILIGADSPQISADLLIEAALLLNRRPDRPAHVIGRNYDGGFYLFGSNYAIEERVWCEAALETPQAAETLVELLDRNATEWELPRRTDVDEERDLRSLVDEILALPNASDAQSSLAHWIESALEGWRRKPR
ncbi:MAG: DUF2064 domain-containing protein [Planctomycetales bacterium]|nr:DUF2064 domain-containing protein [Planctomycetales bacterium]